MGIVWIEKTQAEVGGLHNSRPNLPARMPEMLIKNQTHKVYPDWVKSRGGNTINNHIHMFETYDMMFAGKCLRITTR